MTQSFAQILNMTFTKLVFRICICISGGARTLIVGGVGGYIFGFSPTNLFFDINFILNETSRAWTWTYEYTPNPN